MEQGSTVNKLSTELKELFESALLIGESSFIEAKLRFIISHVEDVENGLDDTFVKQHGDDGDLIVPRWLSNLHRGLRETIRVYSRRNKEILDELQRRGVEPEDFIGYAIGRTSEAIATYAQEEINRAFAVKKIEDRRKPTPRASPLLDVALSFGYVEHANGSYKFTQLAGVLPNHAKGMLTFDMLGEEELAIAELLSSGIMPEYGKRGDYENLMRNMARPWKTGFRYVERLPGKNALYRRTEEGIVRALEVMRNPQK